MSSSTSVSSKRGIDLLRDPVVNKSTAYTEAERQALGLVGLVPDVTESEDLQVRRVLQQLGHKATDLDRYVFLRELQDFSRPLGEFIETISHVRFHPVLETEPLTTSLPDAAISP